MRSRHVSRVIAAPAATVYAYAAEPDHLPIWAAGLARAEVVRDGDDLIVESPMGTVIVTFVARNAFGVLDHDVRLPSGEVVTNPVRVIDHPDGAEIIFTIRQLGASDDEFDRDTALVEQDLATLQRIVEQGV